MRRNCQYCGALVDIAKIDGTQSSVPIEINADYHSDAPRFKIVSTNPLTVSPVTKGAAGLFMPDHRADCPGYAAGR